MKTVELWVDWVAGMLLGSVLVNLAQVSDVAYLLAVAYTGK